MRFITPENATVFLAPGTMTALSSEPDRTRDFAAQVKKSYRSLLEIKHEIVAMTDIVFDGENGMSFTIVEGRNYQRFRDAMMRELVWDTETEEPSPEESVKRWKRLLRSGMVKKSFVDAIRSNDLTTPDYEAFATELTLYMVLCQLDGDFYLPTRDVLEKTMLG